MNEAEFEEKLRSIANAMTCEDPTLAWKAEILSLAGRKAADLRHRRSLPPRWLLAGWAVAWTLVITIHFAKPQSNGTDTPIGPPTAHRHGVNGHPPRSFIAPAVLAIPHHLDLNIEYP